MHMSPRGAALRALSACLLIFAISACDAEEEPSLGEGRSGNIALSAQVLAFNQVALGATDTKELIITNVGEGALRLDKITLVEDAEDDQRELAPGAGWVQAASLAPDESLTLAVTWSPKNTVRDTGKLIITSNDPMRPVLEVALNSPLLAPKLFSPPVVQFPRVPTGTTQRQLTFLQNTGQSPLQLKDILLSPPSNTEFAISFPDPAAPNDPDQDDGPTAWKTQLAPGEQIPVRVAFTPDSDQPATGDLVLYSNDPDAAQYTVRLSGNAGTPCVEVGGAQPVETPTSNETHALMFGASGLGRAKSKTVQLRNCSRSEELTISEITLTDDAGGVYEIATFPGQLPGTPLTIAPLASEVFAVTYTPDIEATHTGRVMIGTNDPVNARLEVDLSGKGAVVECPVAVAEGVVQGSGAAPRDTIATLPLKTVQLSGLRSTDPDGSVARYEWTMLQQPVNSIARPTPRQSEEPTLFLDLAGEYVVELTVTDDQGIDSCESAIVRIQAIPNEDIHVQLVWDTPGDADQTDAFGTDMDLHYLHPFGRWDEAPYDINWRNPIADWGMPGDVQDDPSLDIDDTDGTGPENINHDNPESGQSYAIGVYYYNDNGYGASYATVRVYIESVERFKLVDKYMEREDTFWDVAAIVWPSKQIISRDRLRLGFP